MADKTPAEITVGTPSDTSVVHSSEDNLSNKSRGHNERDISRLQGTANEYDITKSYNPKDLVTLGNLVFRCITATTGAFDITKWTNLLTGTHTFFDGTSQRYAPTLGFEKDISTLKLNKTESLAGLEPVGLDFSQNQSTYTISSLNGSALVQFKLSTAGDISTADQIFNFNVGVAVGETVSLRNITYNSTGSKIYVVDANLRRIYEFDLSTDYVLSTISYNGKFKDVNADGGLTSPTTVTFNGTDTKMFVFDSTSHILFQYDLSIPSDVTSADFVTNSISQDFTGTVDENIQAVSFTPDDRTMYLSGNATDTLYQYNLPTPADITIIELETSTFDFSPFMTESRCVCFAPDFTKAYLISFGGAFAEFDVGLKIEGNIARAGHVGEPSILGDTTFEIFSKFNLPDPAAGAITEETVLAGGSGYTVAELITLSGGTGTGATATATISAGGEVTDVVITSGGSGYVVGDVLTVTGDTSTASNAKITITYTDGVVILPTGVYNFAQNMTLTNRMEADTGANVILTSPNGAVIAISFSPAVSGTTFLTDPSDSARFATQNIQFFLFGTNTTFINSLSPTLNINDTQVVFLGTGTKKIGTINNINNNFSTRDSVYFNYNLGMDIDAVNTINANGVFGFSDGTGTDSMWNISSSIGGTIIFDRGIISLANAGESFVNLDSGITNKITIQDIQFTGIGSFYDAAGLDQTSPFVRAFANDSPDSMTTGDISLLAISPINVTINFVDVPEVIGGGTWTSSDLQRTSADANGILIINTLGTNEFTVAISSSLTRTAGGTPANGIGLTLMVGGSGGSADTPVIDNGVANAISAIGGVNSGYTDGEDVLMGGGTGTGIAGIADISGGVVQSVQFTDRGGLYTVNDVILITGVSSGAANATFVIDSISNTAIRAVPLLTGGKEYNAEPDILIGGDGTGATAKGILINKIIVAIVIITPGTGFTAAASQVGTGAIEKMTNPPRSFNSGIVQINGTRTIELSEGNSVQMATVNHDSTSTIEVTQANGNISKGA